MPRRRILTLFALTSGCVTVILLSISEIYVHLSKPHRLRGAWRVPERKEGKNGENFRRKESEETSSRDRRPCRAGEHR